MSLFGPRCGATHGGGLMCDLREGHAGLHSMSSESRGSYLRTYWDDESAAVRREKA